ncbi:hypothetical protein Tco_0709604 [Tanacetum coccineum]
MLKLGEYEMWEIKIKQYFQIQDYALWEVIENGNSWVPIPVTTPPENGTSITTKMIVPATIEEKTCKKNDVKARSLLLMTLPNEHQLTFDQYVDAQSMFAAIKARFGGNEATKKTQKALLKQYRLAILGVVTPPEDLNVNFLRSLPSEWDTRVVVWMNKPDFDTMGLDDLYNNFKIVEQKVKKSAGASNDDKNLAFLTTSGASSTNNINIVNPEEEMDLKWNMALLSMRARKFYQRTGRKIIIDGSNTAGYDKSKVEMFSSAHKMGHFAGNAAHLSWSKRQQKLVNRVTWQRKRFRKTWLSWHSQILSDIDFKAATYKRGLATLEGKIVKYKEHEVLFSKEISQLKRSVGCKEYELGLLRTELEMVKQEKEGVDFKIAKPTTLDLSYSGLEEFKEPEVNEYGPRDSSLKPTTGCGSNTSKNVSEVEPKKVRMNNDALIIKDWVLDDEDEVESPIVVEKKTVVPTILKVDVVRPKQQEKPVRKTIRWMNRLRGGKSAAKKKKNLEKSAAKAERPRR